MHTGVPSGLRHTEVLHAVEEVGGDQQLRASRVMLAYPRCSPCGGGRKEAPGLWTAVYGEVWPESEYLG